MVTQIRGNCNCKCSILSVILNSRLTILLTIPPVHRNYSSVQQAWNSAHWFFYLQGILPTLKKHKPPNSPGPSAPLPCLSENTVGRGRRGEGGRKGKLAFSSPRRGIKAHFAQTSNSVEQEAITSQSSSPDNSPLGINRTGSTCWKRSMDHAGGAPESNQEPPLPPRQPPPLPQRTAQKEANYYWKDQFIHSRRFYWRNSFVACRGAREAEKLCNKNDGISSQLSPSVHPLGAHGPSKTEIESNRWKR